MAKNIPSALATDLMAGVLTLAVCVDITRADGDMIHLTNHDAPLTIDGKLYRNDVPFTISAIEANSDLAADTCEIDIAIDGTVIRQQDLSKGAYKSGEVKIFQVNWTTPANGILTLREGWFGSIETNKNDVVKLGCFGLLKVLDFSVGRVYQPSCDADLGNKRCRVAIDLSQAYHSRNTYEVGDWVFNHDPAAMSTLAMVNPSFEADGARTENQAITGWIRGPNGKWKVASSSISGIPGATHGIYFLDLASDLTGDLGEEYFIYQDFGLIAAGPSAANIDAGKIVVGFHIDVIQSTYLLDPPRILVEVYDATGAIIETRDTDYFTLDVHNTWRGRSVFFPLLTGARTVRLYLYAQRRDADIPNVGFDNIRSFYYDTTIGTPYSNVIHKVARVTRRGEAVNSYYPVNASFQAQTAVANSSSNVIGSGGIRGWTKAVGDFWLTAASIGGQPATDGTLLLAGGDNASGVQETYDITQQFNLATASAVPAARVLLGKLVGIMYGAIIFSAATGRALINLEFRDAANVVISTVPVYALQNPGAAGVVNIVTSVNAPSGSVTARILLRVETPTGTSVGNIGFDNFRFQFYDAERPVKTDPVRVNGVNETFDRTPGRYTQDGQLVWKATSHHLQYDAVAAVISQKEFNGTNITGIDGSFETSLIRWLSGNNAGAYGIIRVWTPASKKIKLYFSTVNTIQVGDRFEYVRSCQKRFLEDCVLRFDNAINFQGFPYLPSKTS